MKNELIICIIIEVIILYIGIRMFYIWYKKKENEYDYRMLVLEKRIEDYKRLLKNINGFVIPIKDIEKYDINKLIKWLSSYKGKVVKK